MNSRGGAALYTPEVLALATELAAFPLDETLTWRGEALSRVCGSRIALGFDVEGERVWRAGARVTACAIGQAAAAIFLRAADGRPIADLADAHGSIAAWLAGERSLPDWPGLAVLDPARAYHARHAAILLPWKAAMAALFKASPAD